MFYFIFKIKPLNGSAVTFSRRSVKLKMPKRTLPKRILYDNVSVCDVRLMVMMQAEFVLTALKNGFYQTDRLKGSAKWIENVVQV